MELEALPLCSPRKTKGKLTQEARLRESLKNGKGGEVLPNTKKRKNHTKINTQRVSVAIEAFLHPLRQKSFLFLRKGVNLEERSASIASVHRFHLIYRCHLLLRSLQRQEVKRGRWVDDSK